MNTASTFAETLQQEFALTVHLDTVAKIFKNPDVSKLTNSARKSVIYHTLLALLCWHHRDNVCPYESTKANLRNQ